MSTVVTTERASWSDTLDLMDWSQGEHVTLIGPTGRGKTEVELELLKRNPQWNLFLGTKRKDKTQDELRRMDYRFIGDADAIHPDVSRRYVLKAKWPHRVIPADLRKSHAAVYERGLLTAFSQTGWTIVADETLYLAQYLGLGNTLELIWLQGRSQGNAIIASTQRPRGIPLAAYSQATHMFLWRGPDEGDVDRIAETAEGMDRHAVKSAFSEMGFHDILYVNQATGSIVITNTRD